jgi:conjugal transfer ATP-binding protein TraC
MNIQEKIEQLIFRDKNKEDAPSKPTKKGAPGQPQPTETKEIFNEAKAFADGLINVKDIIAPSGIEVDFNDIRIGSTYYRTFFVAGYPREVGPNWLAPLINFSHALDISMFYYPIDAREVLQNLRRKITEMQTELNIEYKEGRILDPEVQLALQDAKSLQEELVAERERFFQFALYITVPSEDKKNLELISKQVESILGGILLTTRKSTLQMEEGFRSTLPIHNDLLKVYRNMDTTSIATTFPFTSSSLTSDQGVMYGINEHNGSLIVFDRFQMENANEIIFGKSGSGKSYTVKLEAIRYLMLGTEILVIDPENEFRTLCDVVGGEYITYDFNSTARINPFDLSQVYEEGVDDLGLKILVLHSLMKVMLGEMDPTQEAVIDRALVETYRLKGITSDSETQKNEPPLMEDLYKVLLGMEEAEAKGLADQLERYVMGSAKGLFDQATNVNIRNTFTTFGIRDLEDSIRPIGMFLILDYIWTRVRRDRRKRMLYVDEAWIMMKNADSANFLHSMAKRARKYYLGVTTISQDIQDFLTHDKGLAIVTNSSIQVLMKQSPTAIEKLADVFYLSEGEQNLLLSANVGEGLFFAGESHVAMQVVASMKEHQLITTNPAELEMIEKLKQKDQVSEEDKIQRIQQQKTSAAPASGLAGEIGVEPPLPFQAENLNTPLETPTEPEDGAAEGGPSLSSMPSAMTSAPAAPPSPSEAAPTIEQPAAPPPPDATPMGPSIGNMPGAEDPRQQNPNKI